MLIIEKNSGELLVHSFCHSIAKKKFEADCQNEFLEVDNLENIDLSIHDLITGNLVISKEKVIIEVSNKIKIKLDNLRQKLIHNETYYGTESYDAYKDKLLDDIADFRELLGNMNLIVDNTPLDQLKEITLETLLETYKKLKAN
ncbi:MAG: hypothetical protein GY793_04750 [Proteobacteria bacterium]|nr:hypothetical protein [Pseudomonadota bacterium]